MTLAGARAGRGLLAVVAVCAALVAVPSGAHALALGFQDNNYFSPTLAPLSTQTMAAVNGSWLRLILRWSLVAPTGSTMPAGFDPSNPGDSHYDWRAIDEYVRLAAAQHLHVILDLDNAPTWAEGPNAPAASIVGPGAWDPDPAQFGAFARAVATRYSGSYPDPRAGGTSLPRVQYFEIWNEENLPESLSAPNPVTEYRSLLDASYDAIKAVNGSDRVSIGGLAPVGFPPPLAVSPLKFAAQLMCLRRVGVKFKAIKSCPVRAEFDTLAFHPYTLAATPTTHADSYNDLLIADTPKLATLLKTATKLRTVRPREKHNLWVTEWSWFTNPPNTLVGDSSSLAARYVSYSMWLLWRSGVKLVIWFTIEDPAGSSQTLANFINGGGLYDSDGHPKLMLQAFEFPFIATVAHGRGSVWGRVPVSGRAQVVIERAAAGHHWIRVGSARTHTDGTFTARLRHPKRGVYRAVGPHGAASLGYRTSPIKPGRTHGGFPI
jgi:hypothetical protein